MFQFNEKSSDITLQKFEKHTFSRGGISLVNYVFFSHCFKVMLIEFSLNWNMLHWMTNIKVLCLTVMHRLYSTHHTLSWRSVTNIKMLPVNIFALVRLFHMQTAYPQCKYPRFCVARCPPHNWRHSTELRLQKENQKFKIISPVVSALYCLWLLNRKDVSSKLEPRISWWRFATTRCHDLPYLCVSPMY
jgi:hypothetical protein